VSALLEIRDLEVDIPVEGISRRILRSVSLAVATGEALGLVGESGSGKSMTARAVTGMLPRVAQMRGEILFQGSRLDTMSKRDLAQHRRSGVALIPQDPRASINPVHTVGDYLTEPLRVVDGLTASEATSRAVAALNDVAIPDGQRRLGQYPHELSGGLLQRVLICAALLSGARLIVADEPTTALDVTTQSDVMAILSELRTNRDLALLFITHDLELAAAVCDRIAVMYAGEVVEEQPAVELEDHPQHPYTRGLLMARPSIDTATHPLPAIPGRAAGPHDAGEGCAFAPRCAHAQEQCVVRHPELVEHTQALVRCVRVAELNPANQQEGGG
jgi:oligopeptide transport system ATP-binding protein